MNDRIKKGLRILGITVAVLLVVAVGYGIVNALFGNGMWAVGWNDYRYDETGYTVGDGTVRNHAITAIELDWIDGEVEIVPCQDTFLSLTETAPAALPDSARLRWIVDTDGTLRVKYRKSSWFFGLGSQNRDKKLILRIPEAMMETLTVIDLETVSSAVSVTGITSGRLSVETASGEIQVRSCTLASASFETVSGRIGVEETVCGRLEGESVSADMSFFLEDCPASTDLETVSGEVELYIPKDSGFTVEWESSSGDFTRDFLLSQQGDRYRFGSGESTIQVESTSGDFVLGILP